MSDLESYWDIADTSDDDHSEVVEYNERMRNKNNIGR